MPLGVTKEGYEQQFGVNHMGHALLTRLLMPTLEKTAAEPGSDVRVVFTTSLGHRFAKSPGIDFDTLKTTQEELTTWARYGQSKLANILYASELARQHPNIIFASCHPGIVNTDLYHTYFSNPILKTAESIGLLFAKTPAQGALCQLWAATAPKSDVVSGEYFEPVGISGKGSSLAKNAKLREMLWEWTEKELAERDD